MSDAHVGFGVIAGVFAWIGAAVTGADATASTLLAAGANVVPPGVFVLGTRQASAVADGIVAWSFLIEMRSDPWSARMLGAGGSRTVDITGTTIWFINRRSPTWTTATGCGRSSSSTP